MTPLSFARERKEVGQTNGDQNISALPTNSTQEDITEVGVWTFGSLPRESMQDLEQQTQNTGTQWCPLELCNREASGLHNVFVPISQRNCLGLAQLAGPCRALACFQLPLAPFMQNTHPVMAHRAGANPLLH